MPFFGGDSDAQAQRRKSMQGASDDDSYDDLDLEERKKLYGKRRAALGDKGIVAGLETLLDAPSRVAVRLPLSYLAGADKPVKASEDTQTFHSEVDRQAEKSVAGKAVKAVTSPVGSALDFLSSATGYSPTKNSADRAASARNRAENNIPEPTIGWLDKTNNVAEDAVSSINSAGKSLGETAFDMVADPLNLVPVGKGTELLGKAGQFLKDAPGVLGSFATHMVERGPKKQLFRESAGYARQIKEGFTKHLVEDVLPAASKIDPARRDQILRRTLDPTYGELTVGDYKELGRAAVNQGVPVANMGPLRQKLQADRGVPYTWVPETMLSPEEQAFAQAAKRGFNRAGAVAQKRGLIENLEKNPVSGAYIPHQFDLESKALQDLVDAYRASNDPKYVAGSAVRSRTAPIPLGSDSKLATEADTRLGSMIDRYTTDLSRAAQYQRLTNLMQEFRGMHPPMSGALSEVDTRWIAEKMQGDSIDRVVRKAKEEFPTAYKVGQAATLPNRVLGQTVLQMNPGFHIRNAVQDSIQSYLHGGPLDIQGRGTKVLQDQAKVREMISSGLELNSTEMAGNRAGIPGVGSVDSKRKLNEAFGEVIQPSEQPSPLSGLDELLGKTKLPISSKYGSDAESARRAGLWDFFRNEKGLSPREATMKTYDALIDYNQKGPINKAASVAFPMRNFWFQAPEMVARGVIDNPGRASQINHALDDLRGTLKNDNTPQEWQTKQQPLGVIPDPIRNGINSVHKAVGAKPLEPGSQLAMRTNTAFEGLGMVQDVADALTQPPEKTATNLLGATNPMIRGAAEGITNKNLLTGRDLPKDRDPTAVPARVKQMADTWMEPLVPAFVRPELNWLKDSITGSHDGERGARLLDQNLNMLTGLGYQPTTTEYDLEKARQKRKNRR